VPDAPERERLPFFTIGHSTRPFDDFVAALVAAGVKTLVDVRTVPRSRRNPQFDTNYLAQHLPQAGIAYRHMPALGGLRKRQPGVDPALNGNWENDSFHNYADYALGEEFGGALDELIALGRKAQAAVMCAEAKWWQCHRRIITDHLLARGETVFHILTAERREPAQMNPAARVRPDRTVTYPADQPSLL
jgi:uncharacterized protein (DUF488 family)